MNRFTTILALISAIAVLLSSCSTTGSRDRSDPFARDNNKFITASSGDGETFRVLISSDSYIINQLKYSKYIKRKKDPGGDSFMRGEMKKYDKINEARESVIRIWLYPDTGRIMKVRPQKPTFLMEIDQLLAEDIQRWGFEFPKNIVEPTRLDIRYRIVLRKKLTDEEILREIQNNMRESQ